MLRTHRSSCCHPSSHEGPRHRTSRAPPRAGLHRFRESLMTSSTSFFVGAGRWALGAGRQPALPTRDLFVGFSAPAPTERSSTSAQSPAPSGYIRLAAYAIRACYICQDEYGTPKDAEG